MIVDLCLRRGAGTRRMDAIDAFRGLTILVMIRVNQMAGVDGLSPRWKHMPVVADAMNFVSSACHGSEGEGLGADW